MLPEYSVRKPYTVMVAVILVIVLGIISFNNMTTDLLPTVEMPYMKKHPTSLINKWDIFIYTD